MFPHRKRQCTDISEKRIRTVICNYSRLCLQIYRGPSARILSDNASTSLAVEVQTRAEQDNEDASEKIVSFVTRFADILLRVGKVGDTWIISILIDLIAEASFQISIMKSLIEIMADFEDVSIRKTIEIMRDDGFHKVLMRGSSEQKHCHGVLYGENVTRVL